MKWFFTIALFVCEISLFCAERISTVQYSQDLPEEEEELIVFEETEFDEDDF